MIDIISILSIFSERINSAVESIGSDIAQQLSKSLQIYTKNWYEKISTVKTFIFQDSGVQFDDIYYPLSLRVDKTVLSDIDDFDKLFKKGNCVSILGNAGCGKSMITKHWFLKVLKTAYRIPIIIELRRLNTEEVTFSEYISKKIFDFELAKNERIMKELFGRGDFIFFIDGYDELALNTKGNRGLYRPVSRKRFCIDFSSRATSKRTTEV